MTLEKTDKFISLSDSGNALIIKWDVEEFYSVPLSAMRKLMKRKIKGVPIKKIVK